MDLLATRHVSFRFEEQHSCGSWFQHLQRALSQQKAPPPPPSHPHAAGHSSPWRPSLYPAMDVGSRGSVPQPIERCISHVTNYGSARLSPPVRLWLHP